MIPLNTPIIEVSSSGIIQLQDMIGRMEALLSNEQTPRAFCLLEDARQAKVTFTYYDLDILVKKLDYWLAFYTHIKHAVVHSKPLPTAFTVAIKQRITAPNYQLEVFSTLTAARKWLLHS